MNIRIAMNIKIKLQKYIKACSEDIKNLRNGKQQSRMDELLLNLDCQ